MNDWLGRLSERAAQDRVLVVGLMSGTSADGVDAALVEISGGGRDTSVREVAFLTHEYAEGVARVLTSVLSGSAGIPEVCALNVEVADAFAEARARLVWARIDQVDIHLHRPAHRRRYRSRRGGRLRLPNERAQPLAQRGSGH